MTTTDDYAILSSTKIRCSAEGSLATFDQILAGEVVLNGNGVQVIPSSGDSTGYNFTGSVAVKRPTCLCTTMHSFYGRAKHSSAVAMKKITFSDGFEFKCGSKIQFVSLDYYGIKIYPADALTVGKQIIKCSYPGQGEQPVQSGCVSVAAISTVNETGKFINAVSTHWPQEEWASSEVRGCVMLENGVYALWIPDGGSY